MKNINKQKRREDFCMGVVLVVLAFGILYFFIILNTIIRGEGIEASSQLESVSYVLCGLLIFEATTILYVWYKRVVWDVLEKDK